MTTGIIVNARFMGRPVSGVERYGREITARLASHVTVARSEAASNGVWGHAWEQMLLPALVNGHVLWSPANTGPIAVRRQVVTLHDVAPLDHAEWFAPTFAAWYGWLLPRLVRRVAHVITVSSFSKARIVRRLGCAPSKITVIPNGVDARFRPEPDPDVAAVRRRHGIRRPYVLTVGSLDPRKNLDRLLRAWAEVCHDVPEVDLLLVSAARSTLRAVRLGPLGSTVRHLDQVDDADLPGLYAGARVFVLPSVYEGFGLPALEAMASGTAVVATNAGAVPEVVGDAALAVDPTDTSAIRNALVQMLGDDAMRREYADRGRRRAARFTWGSAADRTLQVLRSAADV